MLKRAFPPVQPQQEHKKQKHDEISLVWLRMDLRTTDNLALLKARRSGSVVCLFVISPSDWKRHHVAAVKVDFWIRNLRVLQTKLALLGIPLLVRTAPHWRDVPQVVQETAQAIKADNLFYNIEYEIHELKRDADTTRLLEANSVVVVAVEDQCIAPPRSVLSLKGTEYSVFSPFKKRYAESCLLLTASWFTYILRERAKLFPINLISDDIQQLSQELLEYTNRHLDIPSFIPTFELTTEELKTFCQLYPAGEPHADMLLQHFISDRAREYSSKRNFPSVDGTSKLSPYLASGIISARMCLQHAMQANSDKLDSGNAGLVSWISELCWRDFYKHILVLFPRVGKSKAFKPETDNLVWNVNEEMLDAWKIGKTGYPIVDAGMRQLNATGWMHNRLRMITAGFLAKDLMLDWRLGEAYFMERLIDGDFSANNGGWQWSASSGTDSVPYFRVFNPLLQSEKFDSSGVFIRKWVPELRYVKGKAIHDPTTLSKAEFEKLGYPRPIVEHKRAREEYLTAFKLATGKDGEADKNEG